MHKPTSLRIMGNNGSKLNCSQQTKYYKEGNADHQFTISILHNINYGSNIITAKVLFLQLITSKS